MEFVDVGSALLDRELSDPGDVVQIGDWLADFSTHQLTDPSGEIHRVTPKASKVLRQLVVHRDRAVAREELLGSVWSGTCPTDDVLSQAIAELRRTFTDDARNARYIETITKVGYRLVANVELAPARATDQSESNASRKRAWTALVALSAGVCAAIFAFSKWTAAAPDVDIPHDLGAHITPLTSDPGLELYPSIATDGSRVVYAARSQAARDFDLFTTEVGSQGRTRLTNDPSTSDFMPTWSPDGSQIAFLRIGDGDCGIHLVPAFGGFPKRIGDCLAGTVSFLDWSPDGSTLVFPSLTAAGGEVARLHRVDVNTREGGPIDYPTSDSEHDLLPRYSPDGRWLAFRRGAIPFSNLYVMPADGGEPRLLLELNAPIHGADWLSDSSGLVYSAVQGGRDVIGQVDLQTGTSEILDWQAGHLLSLDRNDSIVFSTQSTSSNITEFYLGRRRQPSDRFASTREDHSATYSPDGRQVALISNRSGLSQVWIGDLEDDSIYQVSDIATGMPESPLWAGENSVLYPVRQPDRSHLYIADTVSGLTRELIPDVEGLGDVTVSLDGQWLIYSAKQGDRWQLWRHSLDGEGQSALLTETPARSPRAWKDGYVYFVPPHGVGLWRVALEGGVAEKVTGKFRFRNRRAWTVSDDGVFFLNYSVRKHAMVLQRIRWGSERIDDVAAFDQVYNAMSLSIRPDGKAVLLTRVRNSSADIQMASGWREAH